MKLNIGLSNQIMECANVRLTSQGTKTLVFYVKFQDVLNVKHKTNAHLARDRKNSTLSLKTTNASARMVLIQMMITANALPVVKN